MLFRIFLTVSLPCVSFLTLWRLTERWFETQRVAFPFERYGAAIGLTGFFWTLGALLLIQHFIGKRRRS